MHRSLSILGSTGSVGTSTIDLVEREPERFEVEALTAHRNVVLLAEQAKKVQAKQAVIGDSSLYADLKEALSGTAIEVAAGPDAIVEAASRPAEMVMGSIVGAAGLKPTMAAVKRGAIVALANKECLVSAGPVFMEEVKKAGATVLPVDSEHNAIFQVFDFDQVEAVEKIILTASGGPFRTSSMEVMRTATREQAIAHPNWDMGVKISVDSATMMNKGLEFIEAAYLFPVKTSQIDVLVHPQSVIHSMVAYRDGSVLAQLGTPDMRIPIAYALAWPNRMSTPSPRLDLAELSQLTFEKPDTERFPALRLAREALHLGGTAPTILNAANEIAVQAFVDARIGFLDIATVVEQVLDKFEHSDLTSLSDVFSVDERGRTLANEIIAQGRPILSVREK